MPQIVTNLWFDTEAEEAARFYCGVFPHSRVTGVQRTPVDTPGPKAGEVVTVSFDLDGRPFVAINGGCPGEYTDAVSIEVRCADQAEVDHYWDGLLAGGGRPVQCGWLIDRYGLRWQIVPERLYELWAGDDPGVARRVGEVMLGQVKIVIAELEDAARP